jgi:hypothetical protein
VAHPSFSATDQIAAHCEEYSSACSCTMRTARLATLAHTCWVGP